MFKTLRGAAIALLILTTASAPIGGCAALSSARDAVVKPFPGQDKSVDIATLSYNLLASLALTAVQSPRTPADLKAQIKRAEAVAYTNLVTAQRAQDSGSNAATAIALANLNDSNADLVRILNMLGIEVTP